MGGADRAPVPETVEAHPVAEIEKALAECRAAGLRVDVAPAGRLWGWVRCATGARSLTVRSHPSDVARHAAALRVFLDSHHEHRPRRKRGA